MTMRRALSILLSFTALSVPMPAGAQPPGMWGRPYGDPFGDRWRTPRLQTGADSREGKVDAESFVAENGKAQLGRGVVAVTAAPGGTASAADEAAYEAAIVDQLVKAGYDTTKPDPTGGQVVELKILRDTLVPEEQKRKPVSGETSVTVSNRGTGVGMALNLDFTKPKKALISTRLDAQIKDRVGGTVLWEGHATIATREGDSHWTEQAIAARLAAALFDRFPDASTAVLAAR
ncbi:MAG TPA: hypothetical protein VGE65_07670 [Sphingobium sp.]